MENTSLNLNSARNDKFTFVLSEIPSISIVNTNSEDEMERNLEHKEGYDNFMLSIGSVEIPGLSLGDQKIGTMFSGISVTDMTLEFDPLVTEIKIDANYYAYKLIHTWMTMIKNPFGFNDMKTQDAETKLYVDGSIMVNDNMTNKSIMAFDFVDLHPISLPSLSMDYKTNDELYISVTWGYTAFQLVNNRGIAIKDESKTFVI